jgi:hypothetical protein
MHDVVGIIFVWGEPWRWWLDRWEWEAGILQTMETVAAAAAAVVAVAVVVAVVE